MIRKLLPLLALSALALAPALAPAQTYPAKPIRVIVPFPPGGGTDILARIVGTRLNEANKWTVVIDNKPGAGGTIGIAEAVRMPANGYEMVMGQKDNLAVAPWLYSGLSYDPSKDLTAVALVAESPLVIVTAANSPFKTMADVIAAAKAAPDTITYGSPGNGTTTHLVGEMFKMAAGIRITHVPYKGSNPAVIDTISGQVSMMVSSIPSAMSQVKSGKLRALAVTSARRSASLPDVPTIAESTALKDFDVSSWYGLFMPAHAPKEMVRTVNEAVNAQLALPEVKASILAQGAEPRPISPEAFATLVKTDHAKWKGIVAASGAKLE
ncbi:Bug family tripartite tricarboxylate transporter substrate binding protein [Variovorax ginsengisoli]|uniref:Tripartite-type tricarboxylate transporter receptor subunit TctC n=1 Tax=Variovorax ginsengisoli TaxID=363844 RepID=A0ABT9SFG1_9BURK|nr:tripartite tricarboxylate transporter substrate binding protein [Variovorax ginsengisoli]MDP9902102.1 tripartite-type tricarboxylate transporter receptor subunit TctC [Variovorax ginsengisoli]